MFSTFMNGYPNSNHEFIYAKLAVTLQKFMDVDSKATILDICEKHHQYRSSIYEQLVSFNGSNINATSINKLKKVLKEHSLLYSYCFDHYTLLPPII